MAPRFDADDHRIELAVADLLDAKLFRHLGFGQRGGYERMWVGQAIHSHYQDEARLEDPSYRAEIAVTAEFLHRGWQVQIRGRIDGLRTEADGTRVLEEIKSIRREAELPEATRAIYEQQALLYAWMLSLDQPPEQADDRPEQVAAELVLIEIGSRAVRREPIPVDLDDVERRVKSRLNRLIREFEDGRRALAEQREAGRRLVFPHASTRPGQDAIIEAVARSLEQAEHLLLEAPTGLGKTVAALFPTLRYALEHRKRVFVLTAKTLQQELATAVVDQLNADGTFRSLRLRAKAKMCANDEVICHEEFCPYARDFYLKLHRSRVTEELLFDHPTLLPDQIFAAARTEEVCPFEVSLQLAGKVQVMVCDYNYAFDPYVALQEFGPDSDLDDTILVIDEIHNLVDRGREYYSPSLSASALERAAAALAGVEQPAPRRAAGLCRELAAWIRRAVADGLGGDSGTDRPGSPAAETALSEDELWDLRPDFDDAFVDYLEHQRSHNSYRAEDPFVSSYFDLLRFQDGLALSRGSEFSHVVSKRGSDDRTGILCKDPSRFLGGIINRTHATIGLSATLSPTDFYRDLLGFDAERTATLALPSPFPRENRVLVIDDSVSTVYRERDRNYGPIAKSLSAYVESVPGNTLALFPSYAFAERVAEHLQVASKRVLVQNRDDSDSTREEILDMLRSPFTGDNLLVAVAGGVYAEGVDYPGDTLRAVAVIGPCLPAVTLERELLRRYFDERFERGFEYAYVVPGMTRVVQAAGRLIRSADDTGVIALLDRRFLNPPYLGHLPEDWAANGSFQALAGSPAEAASRFFAGLESCRSA